MVRLGVVMLMVLGAACGSATDSSDRAGGDRRPIVVFAAASLSGALVEMESAFESAEAGLDLQLNVAGSSSLREQLLEGAPADVFAPADLFDLEVVAEAGIVASDRDHAIIARNRMVIAVPRGNDAGVTSLTDFERSELLLGLCAEAVPCGRFARQVLARAGVEARPDTDEPDVRALLTKIEAGELDAGIVYQSDVSAGAVEAIAIPVEHNVEAGYPIAAVLGSPNPAGAEAFIAFVQSSAGQAILIDHGFLGP